MIIGIVQITYHVIEIIIFKDKMYNFSKYGNARITLSSLKCHILYIFTASYLKWYCVSENRGTSRITSSFFCSRTNRWQDWLCSFQSHSYRQPIEPTNVVILQRICYSWDNFHKNPISLNHIIVFALSMCVLNWLFDFTFVRLIISQCYN